MAFKISFIRNLLSIVNIFTWIAGGAILGVGLWILIDFANYGIEFGKDVVEAVAIVVISAGCFVFFVGFIGCCGIMRENLCCLYLYFVLLGVVILIEVAVASVGLSILSVVEKEMDKSMKYTIKNVYGKKTENGIDYIQKKFECCGSVGPEDWRTSWWVSSNETSTGVVPLSCCNEEACWEDGYDSSKIYQRGCVEVLYGYIHDYFTAVAGVCFGVLAIEIFAMVLSCVLVFELRETTKL